MDRQAFDLTRRRFVTVTGGALAVTGLGLTSGCRDTARTFDVGALEQAIGRKVITPGDRSAYDGARFIWNALPDHRPAAIVPCSSAKQVADCVRFAREQGVSIAIKSGGHHVAGFALADGGLTIDVSEMNAIKVDPATSRVTAGPAARVGELCLATEPHRLVVPTAACSTVGIGGMTTGGGEGMMSEFGLSADCLVSAEIVTADGRIRRVSRAAEPDLFWAIRGGGGNFGVVTSFEFQAHPLPELSVGMLAYPLPLAKVAGLKWRDHVASAAPDLTSGCAFVRRPMPAMGILAKYGRPKEEAEAAFADMKALTPALQASIRPVTLTELQGLNDMGNESGGRYFAYSHFAQTLAPEVFDLCRSAIEAAPSDGASIVILTRSSGVTGKSVDATAFPHRGTRFSLLAQTRWDDTGADAKNIRWVKDWWQAMLPHMSGAIYNNYVSDTGPDVVSRCYGPNLSRLAAIKRRYDPTNIFSSTVNILPA